MRRQAMAEAKTAVANKPAWVDLSTSDAAAAREFYSKLFGWKIEVNPDPQYGGGGGGEIGGEQGGGGGSQKSHEGPGARVVVSFGGYFGRHRTQGRGAHAA